MLKLREVKINEGDLDQSSVTSTEHNTWFLEKGV